MATQVEGGATGTKLSIWLKANKLDDIFQALTDAGLEYDDIMQADEDDLKEIFTQEKIARKYLLRLKSALKKLPHSALAQNANPQPKNQSVVVLSSSQNDFILNVYSKKEKISKNASKIQDQIHALTTSSDDIKKQVQEQYAALMKLLEQRKEFVLNNVDHAIASKTKSLNEQLSSVTNAKRLAEQIENDINQCLSSKQAKMTEIQAKMNKIINTAQTQLKPMEPFMDENMPIATVLTCEYKCDQKSFENFIASRLDYVVDGSVQFSSPPIFKRPEHIIFKVKYGKGVNTKRYTVEGQHVRVVEEAEEKQNDDNNNNKWIALGQFNVSHNENQNEEEITVTTDKDAIDEGIYNVRISSDSGALSLANRTMSVEKGNWCWNHEDKDDYITLSNDNLTVTHKHHAEMNHLIRGNVGYTDGVHSFKIRVDKYDGGGSGANIIGFATADAPRQSHWEFTDNSKPNFWGFYLYNLKSPENVKGTPQQIASAQIKSGSVVTVTLDTMNRKLDCYLAAEKVAQITDILWNDQDPLYPALYVGAFTSNTYVLIPES
eukprot:428933_1